MNSRPNNENEPGPADPGLPHEDAVKAARLEPIKPLTDREMEVLQRLPTRLSTVEIGQSLNISPNTVKTHLRSIYHKLGVRSRNEAIIQGVKFRLIARDSEWLVRR
jgi:DNA-binding CsgD family transcriptional regulator